MERFSKCHCKFWKYGVFNGAFHICPIFTKIFSCEIFHVFLDALLMMVIALSKFGWFKIYGLVYRVFYSVALVMLSELLHGSPSSITCQVGFRRACISFWLTKINIYLTSSVQNADLWTFCDHNEGIGWSR